MTKKAGKGTRETSATGERGFTLIELLVVMTILVLMASMFPLALNRTLPNRRVAAAVDNTWSALRYAQSLSAVTGREVHVRLHANQIEIESSRRVWKLTAGVAIVANPGESPREVLTFFPDGSSDGAIIEVASGTRTRGLRVSALTGRIFAWQP